MHCRIIVLLAVWSNVAAAGILRRNGVRAQHHNAARFLNHTEIASNLADIQTSTSVPISSSSILPSTGVSSDTSIFAATFSTIPTATPLTPGVASSGSSTAGVLTESTLSQILSTSTPVPIFTSSAAIIDLSEARSGATPFSTEATVVQPTETLSRLFDLAGTPQNGLQPSINAQPFSSTSSSKPSVILSTVSDVPSATNIRKLADVSSSSAANQASSLFKVPLITSSTAAASQILTYSTKSVPTFSSKASSQIPSQVVVPVPISSGPVQVLGAGGDTAEEFAPVTLDTSSPTPTGTAKYPTAEGGNAAMAAGFNNVYKSLNEDSPCNPADPNEAYACVSGEISECQSDGTYVLKSCPQFQSCYALPKTSGSTGIVVQCAVPSDAHNILAGLTSSNAVPVAATSQPPQTLHAEEELSQATQSVSSGDPVQFVTSSPSEHATIQSQSIASAPSVLATIATASPAQSSDQHEQNAVSMSTSPPSVQSVFQAQSQTFNSPVLATAAAQQVHDPNPPNNPPKSDTSSSVSSSMVNVVSVPKAMFAVVTATENNQVSVPTSQASEIHPEMSTTVIQPSSMSPQANLDNLQLKEASVTSTSLSNADGAGITFGPTGVPVNEKVAVENGQATMTVTVTVTTTERPAPVTIISS